MKYIFNEDDSKSLEERILELNNTTLEKLDISNFKIDLNINVINNFKEKLFAYKDKKFLIVGDYDCDGICATTIIKKLFDHIGINCNYYIPSRIKEGYGLNNSIVNKAKENGFDCLLCVDNGIVASEQLILANDLGLKVFIIDHHEFKEEPNCESYLHPCLFNENYNDMCASGISALFAYSIEQDDFYLCLGGLATLADMVSIFNFNRYLVTNMLSSIKKGLIQPLNLLLGKIDVTYENIQFNVIPKINAVSRLDELMNVNYVVRYLLSEGNDCLKYFDQIENINNARKNYSKQMYNLATRLIDCDTKMLVIKHEDFKEGLCGLVANRILSNFGKPTIIFAEVDGILKGSGRSVPGFNMYEYLSGASDLFETFGGHELAVGLSISKDNYERFIDYINNHEICYDEQYTDVLVVDQDSINNEFLNTIASLEPFGTNFKQPLIAIKNLKYRSRYIVSARFPKFDISDSLSAISFNTNFINTEFEYMIGKPSKDNYDPNKISFIIEDLV